MRLYKLFLVLAIIITIALFPQVIARADTPPAVVVPPARTIHYYAERYSVSVTLATNIARCESQLKAGAKNASSSAKGLYQFLDGTWEHYAKIHWGAAWATHSVTNYGDNAELGTWVIANYGTGDWLSSEYCWNA